MAFLVVLARFLKWRRRPVDYGTALAFSVGVGLFGLRMMVVGSYYRKVDNEGEINVKHNGYQLPR